jgi:hypothetical protein
MINHKTIKLNPRPKTITAKILYKKEKAALQLTTLQSQIPRPLSSSLIKCKNGLSLPNKIKKLLEEIQIRKKFKS